MKKKYHCRNCNGKRNYQILHEVKISDSDEYLSWMEKFCIIQCLGCDTISFLKIYGNDDMIVVDDEGNVHYHYDENIYPQYLEQGRELQSFYLPDKIKYIYEETVSALKNSLTILAAGGLRTIIEAVCNHLKIKKGNLSNRIEELAQKGYLTKKEVKRLHSIRFLGNDALHEVSIPKKENVYILFDIINHMLENLFIQDNKINNDDIDKVVDDYNDFKKLLGRCIKKDMVGQVYTIDKILGHSNRLVEKSMLTEFTKKINEDIENNIITYLSVENDNNYKVLREISIGMFWDYDVDLNF